MALLNAWVIAVDQNSPLIQWAQTIWDTLRSDRGRVIFAALAMVVLGAIWARSTKGKRLVDIVVALLVFWASWGVYNQLFAAVKQPLISVPVMMNWGMLTQGWNVLYMIVPVGAFLLVVINYKGNRRFIYGAMLAGLLTWGYVMAWAVNNKLRG